MTPSDVPPDEMGKEPRINDEEFDRLLSCDPRERAASFELARFVDELRAAYPPHDSPAEDLHVAAMIEATQLLAENGDPVVRPVSNADAPAPQASRLPKQRRNHMSRRKPARTLIKIMAPAFAIFIVMGAMATAGALPRPLQHAASAAAGWVGLDVPTGDDVTADDPGEDEQGDASADDSQGEDEQGDATNEDDQGDQNDQGEDSQDATTEDDQGSATNEDPQSGDTGGATGEDQNGDTSTGSDDPTADDSQGDQNDQGEDSQDATTEDDQGDDAVTDDNKDATDEDSQGDGSANEGGDTQEASDDQGSDSSEDGSTSAQDDGNDAAHEGDTASDNQQ